LTDYTVYEAFELLYYLLGLMDYGIVSGPVERPYTVGYHDHKPDIVRPATRDDIERNLRVQDMALRLTDYYNTDIKRYDEYEMKQRIAKAEKEKKDKGKAKEKPPK
jgi:hypothetical protein